MKLTNLSLSIMVALGVVACGGSDNNTPPPADPPAPQPELKKPEPQPQPEARNDDKIVDPTGTKVVDGRDLSKESTVGGLQYIRRDGSDYDRVYNPDKMASATPLLGVSLDEQNPKLTNIVLARRDMEREENKAVRAQFAGATENEPLTADGHPRENPALQVENFKNVDILAGAFKQVGSADFSAADNRLGEDHNIDTHIQNNTDKNGEFTRDRVAHVYTLRYEYQQPYVDYPHGSPADLATTNAKDPRIARPPEPPSYDRATWEQKIFAAESSEAWLNKDRDSEGVPAGFAPTDTYIHDLKNNTSRHLPNIGLGNNEALSNGETINDTNKYGSLEGVSSTSAPNNAWKNKSTDIKTHNWTASGSYADYKQGYPDGAYPRYISIHPRYQNWRQQQNDPEHNPGNPWYVQGQPRYPNERYNPATRYTDTEEQANTPIGAEKTHRHTYLEREDFTAIREIEPIRPLKNPVPNDWKWDLKEKWKYEQRYKIGERSTGIILGHDRQGNPIYMMEDIYEWRTKTSVTKYDKSREDRRNWHLLSAEWVHTDDLLGLKAPVNQGNGFRGEFRGPAYVGWHEDPRTIRFADERIWKAGAPGYKPEYERKYGANLIWWSTQDSAFENWATLEGWNPRARRVDNNVDGEGKENLLWGAPTSTGDKARDRDLEIQPSGDITNGLIRIGGTDRTGGKLPTLGQELKWENGRWEDHHKTTSRIFGHYHLAWADQEDRKVKDMSMNSYSGARSFVAKVKNVLPTATAQGYKADLDSAPVEYSIGAQPITLKRVQYGRVTSQLDLANGEGPFGDGFLRAPFAKKGTSDSVDNYFFRGIDATAVEDMPQNGSATYNGHALMYGINNDFHGVTQDVRLGGGYKSMPNAFDGLNGRGAAQLGLGNFVEANVDFGTRKVKGDVYNAWLTDVTKPGVVHDKLVVFEGDITGNTVIGKADRAYIPGNDEADFRAAFFGKQADEMGGSFNSVKPDDKYASAYEVGDWGGVFGAVKSASNTFQGDDGVNTYGNSQATSSE